MWVGGARGVGRCSRDEISPHQAGAGEGGRYTANHAAKPGADAPITQQWKVSCTLPPIGTQRHSPACPTRGHGTQGPHCRPRLTWETSHLQPCRGRNWRTLRTS
ncbi:hypothetical protein CP970_35405 [Streptomyces kanamyceticus]|uniref:Uncharacterized protein n=1 Tax=Streptomyces kanamyceticus TaxID=1967 RepID=A0A5J6GHR3_STRKN|nr:hypothetical protein CP970_35405 [Streptomyces kanamyceticus]